MLFWRDRASANTFSLQARRLFTGQHFLSPYVGTDYDDPEFFARFFDRFPTVTSWQSTLPLAVSKRGNPGDRAAYGMCIMSTCAPPSPSR